MKIALRVLVALFLLILTALAVGFGWGVVVGISRGDDGLVVMAGGYSFVYLLMAVLAGVATRSIWQKNGI